MLLSGVAAHEPTTVLRPPTGTSATSLFSVPQPPNATKGAVSPAGNSANATDMQSLLLQLQGGSTPHASAPRPPDPHAPAATTLASNGTSSSSGGNVGAWVGHALKAYGPAIGSAVGGPVGGLIGVALSALL